MNDFLSILYTSWLHTVRIPHFWLGMGFTAAISMFVSSFFFDGDVGTARKALLAKLLFAAMLFWQSVSQIYDAAVHHPSLLTPAIREISFVPAVNVIVVTFAWVVGFILGIIVIGKCKSGIIRSD